MWESYQYKHGKLKLIKDLKNGQAQLRHSLIDIEEIENMGKIYKGRKQYYKICTQGAENNRVEHKEEENSHANNNSEQLSMYQTPEERVLMYRQQIQNNKLKDKYNNMFKKVEERKFIMRNPVIFKMLEGFQSQHKNEKGEHFMEELKESQKNLEHVKINTNRKISTTKNISEEAKIGRQRFISLQNGLPEKEKPQFPRLIDYIQSKYSQNDNKYTGIDFEALQKSMDNIIKPRKKQSHSGRKNSNYYQKDSVRIEVNNQFQEYKENQEIHEGRSSPKSPTRTHKNSHQSHVSPMHKTSTVQKIDPNLQKNNQTFLEENPAKSVYFGKNTNQNKNIKMKSKSLVNNANRTFTRSQNFSREVISTMSHFYEAKQMKKEEYNKMVQFLKHDRPLTSQIRRRNYKIIGGKHLNEVKVYRNSSEQERLNIRKNNHEFYMKLIRRLQTCNLEEIATSIKIMDKIKLILESEYRMTAKDVKKIIEELQHEKEDHMVGQIIKELCEFVGCQLELNQNG